MTITQGSGPAAAFARDRNSRLISVIFGNGVVLNLDYDGRGREVSRSYTTPGTDPLLSIQTGHEPESNVTTEGQVLESALRENIYTYDPLNRLTNRTGTPGSNTAWQYDPSGNWVSTNQNGTNETRTVNDDNEFTLVNGRNLVYDENGNLIFDNGKNCFYDWAGRLIEVESGSLYAHYTYDALNRRVTKTVGSSTTTYVYDESDLIEQYVNGSLDRVFIYTGRTDDPVLTEVNGQSYYYLKDRQNGIRAITDQSGDLVESYRYSPFGLMTILNSQGADITAAGSTINNPCGYTGRTWDKESGLWDYRNRMYDPALGRFLQRDPAGYADGLNLYAYVRNNPLTYTDPDGLMKRAVWDTATTGVNNWYDTNFASVDYSGSSGQPYVPVMNYLSSDAPLLNRSLQNGLVAPVYNLAADSWNTAWHVQSGDASESELAQTLLMAAPASKTVTAGLNYIGSKVSSFISSKVSSMLKNAAGSMDDFFKATVNESPKSGTLSKLEARKWYLDQESRIFDQINHNLPLRERALRAFETRNNLRTQARDLMKDSAEAARLMREEPNMTLKEIVRRKYQEKGLTGDALWQDILDSSQKSRSSVNKALGLE